MRNTGIVRRMDELNRIVVPKEVTRTIRWGAEHPFEILVDGTDIILRPYNIEIVPDPEEVPDNPMTRVLGDYEKSTNYGYTGDPKEDWRKYMIAHGLTRSMVNFFDTDTIKCWARNELSKFEKYDDLMDITQDMTEWAER